MQFTSLFKIDFLVPVSAAEDCWWGRNGLQPVGRSEKENHSASYVDGIFSYQITLHHCSQVYCGKVQSTNRQLSLSKLAQALHSHLHSHPLPRTPPPPMHPYVFHKDHHGRRMCCNSYPLWIRLVDLISLRKLNFFYGSEAFSWMLLNYLLLRYNSIKPQYV